MRNLKRVLSLALASAMLLGMMVMGAGAADTTTYADQNSITNKEAVAVMSAIGTFQGADGKFNPTGVLTRESAAKIITYMVMGKEAADDLSTSSAPFTDVAANRWSAGSIAYCVANGIISGDGQGHFYPELTINGYAFAKMVLVALGYSATNEGLVGTGWEANVSTLVSKAKLKTGISTALSKDMTREQAAQMAFNGLNAFAVSYTGGSNITVGDITINQGGVLVVGTEKFREINYPTLVPSTSGEDSYGRPGNGWKYGKTDIGTFGASAAVTYTETTKESVVKADLSFDASTDVTPVANSKDASITDVTTAKSLAAMTGPGRTIEVYLDANDAIDAVVITDTYLTTISTINTVSKYVRLNGYTKTVTAEDSKALYDALVDMGTDAKVLVQAKADNTILAVAEPETVSGTYTAKDKDGNRTVGGTKYTPSKVATLGDLSDYGSTYTLFLDKDGYLVSAEVEAAAATEYAYALNVDMQGSVSSGKTFLAQLLFNDGTTEWVEVAAVTYKDINDDTVTTKSADFATLAAFQKAVLGSNTSDAAAFISYSEKSDGTYTLKATTKDTTLPTGNAGNVTEDTFFPFNTLDITKGSANFLEGTTILGSSKTVFVVKNGTTYKAYTGVKNVPSMTDATGAVLVGKDSLTASVVFVNTKTNAVDSKSTAYVVDFVKSEYDSDAKVTVYTYNAIVEGKIVELKVTTKDSETAGLYNVEYDSNNYGIKLTKVTASTSQIILATSAKVSNGTVTLTGGSDAGNYVTAETFNVVAIDKDGKAAEITAKDVQYYEAQTSAILILDNDGFATTLIISEVV